MRRCPRRVPGVWNGTLYLETEYQSGHAVVRGGFNSYAALALRGASSEAGGGQDYRAASTRYAALGFSFSPRDGEPRAAPRPVPLGWADLLCSSAATTAVGPFTRERERCAPLFRGGGSSLLRALVWRSRVTATPPPDAIHISSHISLKVFMFSSVQTQSQGSRMC